MFNEKEIVNVITNKIKIDIILFTKLDEDADVYIVPDIKLVTAEKGKLEGLRVMKVDEIRRIYSTSNIYQYLGVKNNMNVALFTYKSVNKKENNEKKRELVLKKVSLNLTNNNIKKYRKKRGYNQGEFAEALELKQQSISAFENLKFFPRTDDITPMLNVLGNITYDELFNTGRLSVYISEANKEKLLVHIKGLEDVFTNNYTEYEKMSLITNHILKIFLEGEYKEILKESIKRNNP